MLKSWPTSPGPNGMTMNTITAVRNTSTGAQVKTIRSALAGEKSSLDSTLRPATSGVGRAAGPDPVGPDPEVHVGDDLELHVDDDERGRDAEQQDAP